MWSTPRWNARSSSPGNGKWRTMFVVSLRDIATGSLTTADDNAVRLWVRADGMVVRQQLQFGGLEINFYRVP